jgi:hypothetical protein
MPPARLLPVAAILAVLAATGCGSSGGGSGDEPRERAGEATATATTPAAPPGASAQSCEGTVAGAGQLRVTGTGCDVGRGVVAAWVGKPSCAPGSDASRASCSVPGGYRCLGAAVERGVAVSCSAPGRSISFLAGRG